MWGNVIGAVLFDILIYDPLTPIDRPDVTQRFGRVVETHGILHRMGRMVFHNTDRADFFHSLLDWDKLEVCDQATQAGFCLVQIDVVAES